jgi:hypothetical protein
VLSTCFSSIAGGRKLQEEQLARGQRIVALMHELWQMPEYKLFQDVQSLDLSLYMFHKNYVALNTILTFLASDPQADPLFTVRNRDKLGQVGRDVVCFIHNYVAAALSLIDHTRNLYNKLYAPAQQFPDYENRVSTEFIQNPLAQFVVSLRQYCQHYKAPNITVQTTFPNGLNARPVRKVLLALGDLQTFDGWRPKAREYLRTVADAVDIQEVATAYRDKVMAFYQWVQARQDEIHEAEFQRFRTKEAELLLLQLEDHIENYFAFRGSGNYPLTKHDVFLNVLSSEDFIQLEQPSLTAHEQADLAIQLFEKKLALPDGLKKKIFRLYEE